MIKLFSLLMALVLWAAPAWAIQPLDPSAAVVEVLQMPVNSQQRQCWLEAEAGQWEPWLEQQDGYRGRDLLWDPERQQAVVLVGWQSQQQWDAIPASSIGSTEEAFNAQLRDCLGVSDQQPLPLQRAGALTPLQP
ncbi:MAG: TIGR03792 family protein [Synechococcus sp.]|nr:TIGR03792 family protein [Synechococcus sp.]